MPADTIQVEASAFLNDVSATGLLKVPDTRKSIGDRAFSGTRIYGAELPASVTEIGESVFSDNPSLVWVRIASSQLQAAEGALEGVPVVIGPKDSAFGPNTACWHILLPGGIPGGRGRVLLSDSG